MERLLPTSVQTFETLRDKGMVYVDKTAYIEKLRKKNSIKSTGAHKTRKPADNTVSR